MSLPSGDRLETLGVKGLTFRYPGTAQGVGPVDLTLRRGTLTVLTGRVGAGKTTLLLALLGLLPRQEGCVLWNGRPVEEGVLAPPRAAFTPQVPRLVSESLRDNILGGLEEGQADLAGALRLAVWSRTWPPWSGGWRRWSARGGAPLRGPGAAHRGGADAGAGA